MPVIGSPRRPRHADMWTRSTSRGNGFTSGGKSLRPTEVTTCSGTAGRAPGPWFSRPAARCGWPCATVC
eukprot:6561746-Pyramimonas_sp.AAC.1